jgi:hypothetical protein
MAYIKELKKYRFTNGYVFSLNILGNIGDAYTLYAPSETADYVPAVAVKINDTQLQIIIQGDYNTDTSTFDIINMRSGAYINSITLSQVFIFARCILFRNL